MHHSDKVTLPELFAISASQNSYRTAAIHHDHRIDFRNLWNKANELADQLRELNLPRGSRVALLFDNSVEYVVAFQGIILADLVIVPIDTSLTPSGISDILNDCSASVLIVQSRWRRHLQEIVSSVASLRLVTSDKPLDKLGLSTEISRMPDVTMPCATDHPFATPGNVGYDDLAAIFYTSGSTGSSKGVQLSHRNLVSNTIATVEYLKLTKGDSVLVILPFYYIYGNSLLLTHLACGGAVVIDNRFMYPEVVLDSLEQSGATGFSGVPSNFMILLNKSTFVQRKFTSLRYMTQAGGAMAPDVIRRLMEAFPGKEIFIMYGQTEAAPRVTWLPPEKLDEKLGSIGIEVPGVTVDIVDEIGNILPNGEAGEIRVSGDNVMLGYWNQPEETAEVLRDGRLYTGDLARRDEDGFIYIIGRRKEIIKTGGNRVSVKEVEERIVEHEAVAEAAVVGVPDDLLGEAIRAVIVLKPGFSLATAEIQAFCQKRLAMHKIPRQIIFAESLPKYQSGKVNKLALKG